MKPRPEIKHFTDAELAILKAEADETDRLNRLAGIRQKSFDRARYEFALEVNRDNVFIREKTVNWARRIHRDLSGRTA